MDFLPLQSPFEDSGVHRDSTSQSGSCLGSVRVHSSHFPTLPGACSVTLELPLGPQPCKPLCLGRKPKVGLRHAWVPISGILGLQLGRLGTKWHLGASPVAKHKKYYKGEGGGFLKSEPWWVLWIYVCPWFVRAPKVLQLCTNQLVIWFMQVHVSNWLACHSS